MLDLPDSGLYRTTEAYPGHEAEFPAGVLVYIGQPSNGGVKFVVRPGQNRNNRWFWGDPTTPLRSPTWARTLRQLRAEGFYTLPQDLEFEGGETVRVKAGESIYIPGGLRHNEIATSDDFQILEVSVPADMGTETCPAPDKR